MSRFWAVLQHAFGSLANLKFLLLAGAGLFVAVTGTHADELSANPDQAPERPAILFNRWQENWSVLADPRVPRKSLDDLKYIPLSTTDPNTYLSFGADADLIPTRSSHEPLSAELFPGIQNGKRIYRSTDFRFSVFP